ncbi:hypothetical protein GSU68_15460 [Rathayibacter sp. VKM Ac-2759]|uniref:hypothetical protein n=1 Tax=Rathayibacter sp. VKM Ac-2759 TaxID=2609252 RepID=UPI001316DC54|nr:hypothetical protein [Rathayibacter sp. VKM Ac-2759]QHC67828.1 hypothetical protein GSU68_15460 [Rathayibacter sp. VKM Ac-2759]
MVDDAALPQIPDSIRALLDGGVETPAFVRDRHLTVVASDDLARAGLRVPPLPTRGQASRVHLGRTQWQV